MRIASLCADRGIPLFGHKGASVHVRSIADALGRRGHDVQVIAMRDTQGSSGLAAAVSEPRFDRVLKDLKHGLSSAGEGVLASEVHGLLSNSLTLAALEDAHAEAPFDAIYERYSLWSTAGLQFARRHRLPFALEVNAPLVNEQARYRELALAPAAAAIEELLFAGADVIFVPSAELQKYVEQRVSDPHVITVPNAADLAKFDPQRVWETSRSRNPNEEASTAPAARGHLAGRFVVAFVGSLKPWHGVEYLLAAFERLRADVSRAHLLVIGDGPRMKDVRATASRLGEAAVTVTGPIPHDQIPGWLWQASVGVAPYPPSDDFYFSPLKVIEYMAAGLPVVASDVGQLRELVSTGETGLLVPPGDVEALCAALRGLEVDGRLRHSMGKKARRRAERRHGWDKVAARIEHSLESLQSKQQRGTRRELEVVAMHAAGRGVGS